MYIYIYIYTHVLGNLALVLLAASGKGKDDSLAASGEDLKAVTQPYTKG